MHFDVWGINNSSMDSLHHIYDIYSIFEIKINVIEFSQNLQIKENHALFHVFFMSSYIRLKVIYEQFLCSNEQFNH